jgi:hypothetical protein
MRLTTLPFKTLRKLLKHRRQLSNRARRKEIPEISTDKTKLMRDGS